MPPASTRETVATIGAQQNPSAADGFTVRFLGVVELCATATTMSGAEVVEVPQETLAPLDEDIIALWNSLAP
jgi:hypothetical protein